MSVFVTFKLIGTKKAVKSFKKVSESILLKELKIVMQEVFTQEIRTDAIENVKSKLNKTKGSGRGLSQNITTKVKILGKIVIGIIGVRKDIKYAAIHEFGGTTHPRVTVKSKRFFWAMFFSGGEVESKWKAMALMKVGRTLNVKIPKMPYLRPALIKNVPLLKREIKKRLNELNI